MALLLGVDTGGTYTDAVLIRDEVTVVASAKSLTTRHDLALGHSLEALGVDRHVVGVARNQFRHQKGAVLR